MLSPGRRSFWRPMLILNASMENGSRRAIKELTTYRLIVEPKFIILGEVPFDNLGRNRKRYLAAECCHDSYQDTIFGSVTKSDSDWIFTNATAFNGEDKPLKMDTKTYPPT